MKSTPFFVIGLSTLLAIGLAACQEPNAPAPGEHSGTGDPGPGVAEVAAPVASSGGQEASASQALCNIESLDGVAFAGDPVPLGQPGKLRGWLGRASGPEVTGAAVVLADEAKSEVFSAPVGLTVRRDDVVAAYPGSVGLASSGFEATISPGLPAGTYHVYLTYEAGPRRAVCDNGRQVRVE